MSALRPAHRERLNAGGPGGVRALHDRLVLSRPVRRFTRLAAHLTSGDARVPRFATGLLMGGLFAVTGIYGTIAGGHVNDVVGAVSSRGGFAISDVHVTGNQQVTEIDVLQAIGLDGWTSLVGFNAASARARIDALPWVEKATVRKVYPATLEVKIVERKPFAIWQHDDQLSLIERSGEVIAPYTSRFADLPLMTGKGAREVGPAMLDEVRRFPGLAARVKAYVHIGNRRWDIVLDNGITVKLPEFGEEKALAALARLDKEHGLLSRDILAVDMRLRDRLVVKLTPDAAEKHKVAIEKAVKSRRKLEINI